MTTPRPEPWLRGPLTGIPAGLQPAAHALVMALEDIEAAVHDVSLDELWLHPGGAASLGFHLMHLAGSTDRLLTYARGDSLSGDQKVMLAAEQAGAEPRPTLAELLEGWRARVDSALEQLAATPEATFAEPRYVGRARLPTTVLGLLFHAAEHAQRHLGQIVTTAKFVRSQRDRA